MNNRQQAREEALFVLLMDQVARQQDRQARQLGQALEEDPEAALSQLPCSSAACRPFAGASAAGTGRRQAGPPAAS